MSPGARARSDAKTQKMIEEMALNELGQAMGITQERLAKVLRINQAGASEIESRSDIFVSTLRKAIEVMGGKLEIRDFHHKCIHVRRSAWYGKAQSTKSKASAAPVTLPDALANVLREYRSIWTVNPAGWLFATRNSRPPSSNNVVEYSLWPILEALDIPRCGLQCSPAINLLRTIAQARTCVGILSEASPSLA